MMIFISIYKTVKIAVIKDFDTTYMCVWNMPLNSAFLYHLLQKATKQYKHNMKNRININYHSM